MPYSVRGDELWFDETRLGPTSALYADHGELKKLGPKDGVRRVKGGTPGKIDFVFAVGTRVAGVESKRPHDYDTSTSGKRLARQLRTMRDLVDIQCLMLRGWPEWYHDELVKMQMLGVVILPGPDVDAHVPDYLFRYRKILDDDNRTRYSVLAGTDKKPVALPYTKGRFLGNVQGIGETTREKLHSAFGSTRAVFDATDEELRKYVSATILRRLREVMS